MLPRESPDRSFWWGPRLAGLGFVCAVLVQANVQVFGREKLLDLGDRSGRFYVKRAEQSKRGTIFSADGRVLAQDEDASEFAVFFNRTPDSGAFFLDLSEASGVPAAEFLGAKSAGARRCFWSEPLNQDQTRKVLDVKTKWRADGISVRSMGLRNYPLSDSISCLIGNVRDGKALAGFELGHDKELQGKDGLTIGLTDLQGRFLPMRVDPRTRPRIDGATTVLTIDSELQMAASSALRDAVDENNADSGSAIVLDPVTGDVLAMANWPSFDPKTVGEKSAKGTRISDFNPNVMAALEPGSTFKILTLALAMDMRAVKANDFVNCKGSIPIWAGRSVRCDMHHGTRNHGRIDPEEAIAKSCNVSAAIWALRIGYVDFAKFLDRSGLMEKTHLGLPLERGGEYVRDEYAKRLQLATFGFGQSLTCTPLGLASAFSALANGGVRMEPRLVKSINGKSAPIKKARTLFSPDTSRAVINYMESVLDSDEGTGKSLRIPGYRIAGKTGTAQKINAATGTTQGGGYVSNFVGFLPAEKPRAVILVMIDNPKAGRYYGAAVAGPVFDKIARSVIQRFSIPPSSSIVAAASQKEPSPGLDTIFPLKAALEAPRTLTLDSIPKRSVDVSIESRRIGPAEETRKGRVSP